MADGPDSPRRRNAKVADDLATALRGKRWAPLALCALAAHVALASLEAEPMMAALAAVVSLVAATLLWRAGPTLLGPALVAVALLASLAMRPVSLTPAGVPDADLPRPRALAPLQRLQIASGARLTALGVAVDAHWLQSCGLQGQKGTCARRDGLLQLDLRWDGPPPPQGSLVRVQGFVQPLAAPANPGFEGLRQLFVRRGASGRVVAADAAAMLVERQAPTDLRASLDQVRLHLRRRLHATMGADAAAMACGLGLGDRSRVGQAISDLFLATGTSHVLAVSGTHVAAVLAVGLWLLGKTLDRLCPALWRLAPRALWLWPATTALAFGYAALAGMPASAARSAAMASIALGFRALLAPSSLAESLGGAVLVLLVFDPHILDDLGLGLSVLGVLGAIAGAARAAAWWRPPDPLRRAVVALFGASIGAFATTAALAVPAFGALPLAAPIANLLIVPWISVWLQPLSLVATLGAALPAGQVTDGALHALGVALDVGLWPLHQAAAWPYEMWPWWRPPPALVWPCGLLWTPALALLTWPPGGASRRGRMRVVGALATLALLAAPCLSPPRARAGCVELYFFDVAHGDALLLRFDDGSTMLIDGGGEVGDDGRVGRRMLVPALHALDVRRIDLMVLSHPHPDHQNGLLAVARALPVGAFWSNGQGAAGAEHKALRALLQARRTPTLVFDRVAPRRFTWAAATLQVLWPSVARAPADPNLGANDNSLVLLLTVGDVRLLLTGDVEGPAEAAMLAEGLLPDGVDVLKVPHHGSRTSSSAALIARLQPRLALAGARRFGALPFPDPDVEARYRAAGIPLWVAGDGHVRALLRPDGVTASQGSRTLHFHSQRATASQAARAIARPSVQPGGS